MGGGGVTAAFIKILSILWKMRGKGEMLVLFIFYYNVCESSNSFHKVFWELSRIKKKIMGGRDNILLAS